MGSMRELRWGVELVIEPARRVEKELPLLDDDLSSSHMYDDDDDDDGAEKFHPGPTHAFSFS